MATAREENPYEGGALGTGGKFRKRPVRRSTHTRPYDRPATAVRNPSGNNGWLSKLVDPAQRLITYSAHRLFSSVRKRLGAPPTTPPPLPPTSPSSEMDQEARDNHLEAAAFVSVINDSPGNKQGAVRETDIQSNCADRGGFIELENLLKQKTFTRSEIDRLTALLLSKAVDSPIGAQKRTEAVPSEPVSSHEQKEEFPNAPALDNGIESRLVSTPFVHSSALDEDVASPAELAKAYMGSRPSKMSPSMLSLQSPALKEDITPLKSQHFPSKTPVLSILPRISSQAKAPENGFMSARSRGRSAIYSMARTPYAKVYPTSTSKVVGVSTEVGLSSSSHFALDHDMPSGSNQGALKRRSSVLDSDIGSRGPIRRIHQKSNIPTSRGLSLPVSGSPLSIARSGGGADGVRQSSSFMQKTLLTGEPEHNRDDTMPSMSAPPLPSKSTEVATKILQQLDKLVSPKEKSSPLKLPLLSDKSPTKLSPSMLYGQARRSLEIVDSSKFLGKIRDSKLDGSLEILSSGAQKLSSMPQDKVENGPFRLVASSDINKADATFPSNQTPLIAKSVDYSTVKPVSYSQQKKRAFHMSAHEDYLELDDDDGYPNEAVSCKEKTNFTVVTRNIVSTTEDILQDKPPASSIVKPIESSAMDHKTNVGTTGGSVVDEKVTLSSSITPTSSSLTLQSITGATANKPVLGSDKATSPNGSIAAPSLGDKVASLTELTGTAPKFSFGEKVVSSKESATDASVLNFSTNKIADKVPKTSFAGESIGLQFGASFNSKLQSSTSPTTVSSVTDSMPKVPESVNGDGKTNTDIGFSVRVLEPTVSSAASTSSTGIFSFGYNLNQNNGSLASSPSFPYQFAPVTNNSISQNLLSSSFLLASSRTSITAAPITGMLHSTSAITASINSCFSTSAVSSSSGSEPVETKSNQDPGFGNVSSTGSGLSASIQPLGTVFSSVSGPAFGANIHSQASMSNSGSGSALGANNQSQGSVFSSSSGSALGAIDLSHGSVFSSSGGSALGCKVSPATTGFAPSTQSQPFQSGSSPSFGLAGNTAFFSGNSVFTSPSPAANVFNSGTTFGLTSASSSAANSVSSNSGTTSSPFGVSSWQPGKSPFGSLFTSPSTGFSFGASTSSASTSATSSPMAFGSSNGASSSPMFSFTLAPATTSTQAVFPTSNSVFAFNSSSLGNNDQMSMEDTMAEDTVQATPPAAPAFSQQPAPPSNFVFGAPTSSGASPYQFGAQQSIASPNPSPFQASGSLEFNAGGSFSLGTGDKSSRKFIKVKHKQRKK